MSPDHHCLDSCALGKILSYHRISPFSSTPRGRQMYVLRVRAKSQSTWQNRYRRLQDQRFHPPKCWPDPTCASSQTQASGSSEDPAAGQQSEEGTNQIPSKMQGSTSGSTVSQSKATYQVGFLPQP